MSDEIIKKLESSLPSPWEERGLGMEDYAKDLTERVIQVDDLIKGRRTDTSIVKSTVNDTLEFIAWANAKKEITSAVALIRAKMMKAQGKENGESNRSTTKRLD